MKIGLLINGATGFELFWASLPLVDDEVGLEPVTEPLAALVQEEAAADEVAAQDIGAPDVVDPLVAAPPPAESPATSETEELEHLLKQTHETAQSVQDANLKTELQLGNQMMESTSALDDVLSDVPEPGLKLDMPAIHAKASTSLPPVVSPAPVPPVSQAGTSMAAQAVAKEVKKLEAEEAKVEKAAVESANAHEAKVEEAKVAGAVAGETPAEEITDEAKPPKTDVQAVNAAAVEGEVLHKLGDVKDELDEIENESPNSAIDAEVEKVKGDLENVKNELVEIEKENPESAKVAAAVEKVEGDLEDAAAKVVKTEQETPLPAIKAKAHRVHEDLEEAKKKLDGIKTHMAPDNQAQAKMDQARDALSHDVAAEKEENQKLKTEIQVAEHSTDQLAETTREGQPPAQVQAAGEEVKRDEEAVLKEEHSEEAQVKKLEVDLEHAKDAEAQLKTEGQLPAPVQAAEKAEEVLGKEAEEEGVQAVKDAEAQVAEAKPIIEESEGAKPQVEPLEVKEAEEARDLAVHEEKLEDAEVKAAQGIEVKAEQAAAKEAQDLKAVNHEAEAETKAAAAHSDENSEAPNTTPNEATLHELSEPLVEAEDATAKTLEESPTTLSPAGNIPKDAFEISKPLI